MPLHVFEPRYRQMVAHCVEGDRRFGLIYHDPDRSGPFSTETAGVGCVAEILQFDPIPDGRSLLKLRGAGRFRVDDGIESESLYYEALVTDYQDEIEDPIRLQERTRQSVALFQQVLAHISSEPQPPLATDEREPLSFQLARWIRIDPSWQQELLEIRSESGRLSKIDVLLHTTLTL